MDKEKIGFIGLGIMGSRMAANLLKAGYELVVHNRSKAKATDLLERGAVWAESPTEVAEQCQVVWTMLSTPEVVQKIFSGPNGLAQALGEGHLWVDSSTVDPEFTRRMAEQVALTGAHYLEAPVAGTKGPAENGELMFLMGGDAEDIERVRGPLDVMGRGAAHFSGIGAGASMKLIINQLLAQSVLAFAEALSLGDAMGIPQKALLDTLLKTPVVAPVMAAIRPRIESGSTEPNFPLQWIQKDLHLASLTAYQLGLPMPLLNTAKEVYAQAKAAGHGEEDFTAIFAHLRKD